ncbi:MAG: Rpn family recombination-promoting nuclease/putative transposase [Defluviitaleaceae bacterium]|nr:Rpn family recombination-promoting nuclease/putative transposase [Defluviitaleaceae bacterium]
MEKKKDIGLKNETEPRKELNTRDYSVRNSKDSLFRYIFSDSDALEEIYTWVSGKNISRDNIEPIILDEKLQRRSRFNDTAFITNDDRLIVFLEHQSTLNITVAYRMLEYYVDVMRSLKLSRPKNLSQLPMVEMYVAYNGKQELKDEEKVAVINLGAVQIKVDVVDVRFEALPKERTEDSDSSLAGYAYFVKFFEEGKASGKTAYESYHYAINECAEAGYLADIVNNKELIDMFGEHYSYDDQIFDEGREYVLRQAIKNGSPIPLLETLAEYADISTERLYQILEEMKGSVLV